MKIFAISDIHGEIKFIPHVADQIKQADLITISGDISRSSTTESAEIVLGALKKYNVPILAVHGNWDRADVIDLLDEKEFNLHSCGKIINNIGFFGAGGSNPTPMKTPSEYSEEEILDFLNTGYQSIKDAETIVLLSHTPPHHTVDRTFLGLRGGSNVVRDFIETHRVDLCLCGHIHEARGSTQIGSCTIVNPGSFKKGRYCTIEIGQNKPLSVLHGKAKRRFFSK